MEYLDPEEAKKQRQFIADLDNTIKLLYELLDGANELRDELKKEWPDPARVSQLRSKLDVHIALPPN